ncbi:hypothetical protein Tco_1150432 [Tanacetum coccineum]
MAQRLFMKLQKRSSKSRNVFKLHVIDKRATLIGDVSNWSFKLEIRFLQKLEQLLTDLNSQTNKCFSDKPLVIPLDEIQIADKLHIIEEPAEIMDREVKCLNQSRILIVKVHWNSRKVPNLLGSTKTSSR